jgi:peptidoglycan hydrolase-like protein with peptidoglycan-binding domain
MVRRRQVATVLLAAAVLVGVAAGGYWAGSNVIAPPALQAPVHATQTYTAQLGAVGRTAKVPVTASWPTAQALASATDGVLTTVQHAPGDPATSGEVIATIDLRPVVVAEGPVPMFRALHEGLTGPDVLQFQRLLKAQGFLSSPADGRFTAATVDATRKWQHSIGDVADGVVDPGAVLFVDHLPARLVVIPGVGSRLGVGAEFVHVLADRPSFEALVSASTRAELHTGMPVAITGPGDARWFGSLGTLTATADGRYTATIQGPLCDDRCDTIPVDGDTALSGSIEIVPATSGVVVPVSALLQLPSGGAAVTLRDGTTQAVRVVAMAEGLAVVDGLAAGTAILLPAPIGP